MQLSLRAFHIEGGGFVVFLVIIFILAGLATFVYLDSTDKLVDYKINMFSSVGSDNLALEESQELDIAKTEEGLSIGVTANNTEQEANVSDSQAMADASIVKKVAQKGDSITTLARKAVEEYLEDKGVELTKEHRIYIEDYIQNSIGDYQLKIGQEIEISKDLIAEAVEKSQQLSQEQLKNLENYSELVWE